MKKLLYAALCCAIVLCSCEPTNEGKKLTPEESKDKFEKTAKAFMDACPASDFNDLADFATSPLTLILDGAEGVAPNLIAEDGSLGMRVTREEFSRQLCYRLQKPLVSTSANLSGMPTARCFAEIPEEIKSQVDYIVQFRRGEKAPREASKILKLGRDGEVTIIR